MNLRRKQYNTAARETQSARRAEPKDRRALRNEECTNRTATLGLELLLPGDSSTGCMSIVFFRNGDDSPLARDLVQVRKRTSEEEHTLHKDGENASRHSLREPEMRWKA
jgi:hypothetical protein